MPPIFLHAVVFSNTYMLANIWLKPKGKTEKPKDRAQGQLNYPQPPLGEREGDD
jgi:hypothetical protein